MTTSKRNNWSILLLLMIAATAIITMPSCGCGGEKESADTPNSEVAAKTEIPKGPSEDPADWLWNQPDKLAEIQKELEALPQFAGKPLRMFHEYRICRDNIEITLQDPNKPENVDQYEYKDGKWNEPSPVQLMGDGDITAHTIPLSEHPFALATTASKTWIAEAEKLEGWNKELPRCMNFMYDPATDSAPYWSTTQPVTERASYFIELNADGTLNKVTKQ